jgi:hypothetical protein
MAHVYSTQFLAIQGLDGTVYYDCPLDRVLVLRDLDAYANVTVASRELYLRGSAGQTIYHDAWGEESQHSSSWRGRQVISPGQQFSVFTSDLIDVSVSGYLLTLP